jgi:hypothetical protein
MSKMNNNALKEYWRNGNMLVPGERLFIQMPLRRALLGPA